MPLIAYGSIILLRIFHMKTTHISKLIFANKFSLKLFLHSRLITFTFSIKQIKVLLFSFNNFRLLSQQLSFYFQT